MKLCEIVIKPVSAFGTPLKGDTLFGQFCWQLEVKSGLLKGDLGKWLQRYPETPFSIFSSAFPVLRENHKVKKYFLPAPTIPLHFYGAVDFCIF